MAKNDIIPFSYIREKLSEKSTKILIVAIVRFKKNEKRMGKKVVCYTKHKRGEM
jgi:hypothetical protein